MPNPDGPRGIVVSDDNSHIGSPDAATRFSETNATFIAAFQEVMGRPPTGIATASDHRLIEKLTVETFSSVVIGSLRKEIAVLRSNNEGLKRDLVAMLTESKAKDADYLTLLEGQKADHAQRLANARGPCITVPQLLERIGVVIGADGSGGPHSASNAIKSFVLAELTLLAQVALGVAGKTLT